MQSEQTAFPGIFGVDIGGTFTDVVFYRSAPEGGAGELRVQKVPGMPADPAQALLRGIADLDGSLDATIIHGSTVATNALLERRGACAALVTTEGFADVLEIGRQDRPALYDLMQQRPPVLIPRARRLELSERLAYTGEILRSPTPEDYERLLQQLAACQPESVAIALLHAYRNPVHERELAERLRAALPQVYLSLASDLLPQFREYERSSTVAVNAYVQPLMARYLANLQAHIRGPLRVMQSSGGSISAETAAREPVRTVLSGPAGGVIGAFHVAQLAGFAQIITLDMGGTSTDVALCPGGIVETSEAVVAGCPLAVPTVAIHTVGAGGGSLVRLDAGNALTVGPESAGADPGPACYGRGDALTVTDANVVLGRIDPASFLGGAFRLYPERSNERMEELALRMGVSVAEAALGIIRVANASMERAIRTVSLEKGYDPRLFTLLAFGGAGPLHACELAETLRIPRVFIPRYPGVLSALGLLLAPIVKDYVQGVMLDILGPDTEGTAALPSLLTDHFAALEQQARIQMQREIAALSPGEVVPVLQRSYDLCYIGQAYELTVSEAASGRLDDTLTRFHELHEQRFGHSHPQQPVRIVAIRLKAVLHPPAPVLPSWPYAGEDASQALLGERTMVFARGKLGARVYERERLRPGNRVCGPALLVQMDSTILLPPGWEGRVDARGNLLVEWQEKEQQDERASEVDPVSLEIFKHLFASAAEEMGVTLGRTAYSPNIKERKDYSCACFDARGRLIAQAAHIPVHLGAMPASVRAAIERFREFAPGDVILLNDPYLGGTHLPDITMVSPVFIAADPAGRTGQLFGFVASRAHHADIGGMSPGSMPMSRELYQEGVIIPPLKVIKAGIVNEEVLELFYRNVRTPDERRGDMQAQLATARVGERRLQEIIARYGSTVVQTHADALLSYTARLVTDALARLPDSQARFTDYLDDDGWGATDLPIQVQISVRQGRMRVDFTGSASPSVGCLNTVSAVVHSAVLYVVRCLVGEHVPANQGILEPIEIVLPTDSLLNPQRSAQGRSQAIAAAVAAGNVETSQRIVDALFGALASLARDRVPAASQGTMNNLSFGGYDRSRGEPFAYYETVGGGMGARPGAAGLSGVHVHMSNTRNTPVEVLEMSLPVRVRRYALREGSGGAGRYRGGDGLCRELLFLEAATVTLLTERRNRAPYGLWGGKAGLPGANSLERLGKRQALASKVTLDVGAGDILSIHTPGGGGFLPEEDGDGD
jgi:N-methylhydantoinase B/oxoprolinase/acetone carboxylase alpha subunit/N-methylhydantoinase A/oxoprolinase/acetone carboxylase beta subunit